MTNIDLWDEAAMIKKFLLSTGTKSEEEGRYRNGGVFSYVVLDSGSQFSSLKFFPNGLTKLIPSMTTL